LGALKAGLAAIALSLAVPAGAAQADPWAVHIDEASRRFGIPEAWIRRVMAAESGGRTLWRGRPIESHAGAMGLMQVMPGTWRELRAALGLGSDPHDPRDNILAGTAYLRAMHDRFGYPGLFAAYNAGPGRYAQHLTRGRRLPAETIAYVATVAGRHAGPPLHPARSTRARSLFVTLGTARPEAEPSAALTEPPPAAGLFVRLHSARKE
jgi:soluble lytic murein transglycosylase-like protein